ncbi:helix-turn-helix transcriptional regulator [Thauera humireducens]|uniref:helix-turn-helix transcriptional regulator n=1 Tax=Thauera humireducens TaxID=1134435 RepID=UPI0009ECD5E7|nr:transcriptional regulator [Thauera humireducens]
MQPQSRHPATIHHAPAHAALAQLDSLPDSACSLNVNDVALILGKSPSSVWRDARSGKLPAPIKTGPMTTRWNVGAIRRHLASLGVSA